MTEITAPTSETSAPEKTVSPTAFPGVQQTTAGHVASR